MSRARLPASRAKLGLKVGLLDATLAFAAPCLAYFVRDPNVLESVDLATLLIYGALSAIVSTILFRAFRIAQAMPQFFSFHDAVEIAKASGLSVAVIAAILFTVTRLENLPRSIPIIHFLLLTAFLVSGRLARRALSQRADRGAVPTRTEQEEAVLLIGATRLAWFYVRIIDMFGLGHRRVLGILDVEKGLTGRSVFGHFVLGTPDDARHLVEDFAAHGIPVRAFVICERGRSASAALGACLATVACDHGIAVEDLARQLGIDEDDSVEETTVPLYSRDVPKYLRARRIFDAALSAVALVALSPVLLLVAAGVWSKLDAPVIFWQQRVGRNGCPIRVYKFRSMANPFDKTGRLLSASERASSFGDFLRATRLDELPQLYNVMRGDMALIGPRPLLPRDQPASADVRLSVAPGITGWAQIHGGKLVGVAEKNALDEYYVRNASLRLDARIVLKTMITVFFGDRRQDVPDAREPAQADNDDDDRAAA